MSRKIKIGGITYDITKQKLEDNNYIEVDQGNTRIILEKFCVPALRWQGLWLGVIWILDVTHNWRLKRRIYPLVHGITDVLARNGDLRKTYMKGVLIGSLYYRVEHIANDQMQAGVLSNCKDGVHAWGWINHAQGVIKLNEEQSEQACWATVWHEVIHGISMDRDITIGEALTESLAQSIIQVLRDNPWAGAIQESKI